MNPSNVMHTRYAVGERLRHTNVFVHNVTLNIIWSVDQMDGHTQVNVI